MLDVILPRQKLTEKTFEADDCRYNGDQTICLSEVRW